ncbi:MAG TPA: gas vesicle protein GvpG [Chloroflexota bacterium]|nr:gas vesicle protein GvpG [Chloroflexota bacterium]
MLFQILGAPIGGPIAGMKFIFNQILEMAERELYDEDRIREDLLLLQLQLEEGEVSEDEYVEREAEIMARLREARAYHAGAVSAEGVGFAGVEVVADFGDADEGRDAR